MDLVDNLKKIWNFLWNDDSLLSWVVNIVLAFILIKFIVYPGLGFLLSTTHPVVAVVSESMEHKTVPACANINSQSGKCENYRYILCDKSYDVKQRVNYDFFWKDCGGWYEERGISKNDFTEFRFNHGFNKGDIMVLRGKKVEDIEIGETIVFKSRKPDPIIHRVVQINNNGGEIKFQTKGDHNDKSFEDSLIDETNIGEENIIGTAVFRIPLLGYIKIGFVEGICYNPVQNFLRIFFKNLNCRL